MEHRARGLAVSLRAGALIVLLALAAAGCSGSAGPAPSSTPPAAATSAAAPSSTASASGTASAPPDWPMYHGDPSHSGLSRSMPNVNGSPRVTESIKLDGAVYASPIAVDGVIVVATENDSVYAFDAEGKQLWHVKVGSPSPAQERACGDIDPLGITGTPVYSAQTGDVYLVAEHNGKVGHDMIALDL
ncbi:MAG TPA: PQQ-binding-like beta-propeller repeat protein, partial [Streptosporangiaceae bacterium]